VGQAARTELLALLHQVRLYVPANTRPSPKHTELNAPTAFWCHGLHVWTRPSVHCARASPACCASHRPASPRDFRAQGPFSVAAFASYVSNRLFTQQGYSVFWKEHALDFQLALLCFNADWLQALLRPARTHPPTLMQQSVPCYRFVTERRPSLSVAPPRVVCFQVYEHSSASVTP